MITFLAVINTPNRVSNIKRVRERTEIMFHIGQSVDNKKYKQRNSSPNMSIRLHQPVKLKE